MSNECPLPPDDVVIEAALSAMREANFYPNSAWELRDALAAFAGVETQLGHPRQRLDRDPRRRHADVHHAG